MASGDQVTLSRSASALPPNEEVKRRFPDKLYLIVNDEESSNVVRWSEGGDSFIVLDRDRFAREVIVKWFNHGRWRCFRDRLNEYGFRRVERLQQDVPNSGSEVEFGHPDFRKGRNDMLCHIQRKKRPRAVVPEDHRLPTKQSEGIVLTFPQTLYRIVNDDRISDVVRWSEKGDSFIVSDRKRFAQEVIVKRFNTNRWKSFARQLGNYGFREVKFHQQDVSKSRSKIEFGHPNFRKGQDDMLCHIRPKAIVPEDHSPLPAFPQSTSQQILPSSPSGQMLDTNPDGILIKRHRGALSSEFGESNEYLLQDAVAGHIRYEDTTSRILEFPTGVFGSAAASPVHRSDGGDPQIDVHARRKRQQLMIADNRSGNTHGTLAHATSRIPSASEFTPINDHAESTPSPPGPRVSTPTPGQATLPTQNTSRPMNSVPVSQFNPTLPFNTDVVNAADVTQSDAVQDIINQMMSCTQPMQILVQALRNSTFPIQSPPSSASPVTMSHPSDRLTTYSPAQLHPNHNCRDPTPSHPILPPAPSSSTSVTAAAHISFLIDLPWNDWLSALNEQDTRLHGTWENIQEVEDDIDPTDLNIESFIDQFGSRPDDPQNHSPLANTTGSDAVNLDRDQVDLSSNDSSFSDPGGDQTDPPVPVAITQPNMEESEGKETEAAS